MAHTGKDLAPTTPLLLAIENSGMCGSVALICPSYCLGEYSLQSRQTHSKRLLPGIQRLIKDAGVGWQDIDGIAVSIGPGSFTGLRIGLSTAKGLATAASLPLIGISSLESLALQYSYTSTRICAMIDARKKEVYCALFKPETDGSLKRLTEDLALSPEKAMEYITEPTLFTGDGVQAYKELIREKLRDTAIIPFPHLSFPRAAAVGFLALSSWAENDFLDISKATPAYIRASEVEEKEKQATGRGDSGI
ncbi:MAG: tRNA (adenosine(37)-N6)-threonylcarbamoyltransferase complex dimerization subunit type 1 TsaB [Desulfurivibrionaceae bacterium]